jgi:hypothetical protein
MSGGVHWTGWCISPKRRLALQLGEQKRRGERRKILSRIQIWPQSKNNSRTRWIVCAWQMYQREDVLEYLKFPHLFFERKYCLLAVSSTLPYLVFNILILFSRTSTKIVASSNLKTSRPRLGTRSMDILSLRTVQSSCGQTATAI